VAEQTDFVRGELREAKRQAEELRKQLATVEELRQESSEMQRTMRNEQTRLNVLQEEFHRLEKRSSEMAALLRDYYAGVVNPLTIATASVDLLPVSKMAPDDAETVTELRQNLNEIRATIAKLVTKMSELGIPTERPAQEPAPTAKKDTP
jgi:uncharacterized coiled-coil DUF342 family protein